MKYLRKAPSEVDAWQWTGILSDADKHPKWLESMVRAQHTRYEKDIELHLLTIDGSIKSYLLSPGTWLVLDDKGDIRELVNSAFLAQFEPVSPDPTAAPA